jgi:salicylate biosynthesis isochorismate synthase/menaquinone-specific isochorismate synthase
MLEAPTLAPRELRGTPDLADLVSAARDAGHEVVLIDRPMPDAVSVLGIGRRFDIVSTPGGAVVEDAEGRMADEERSPDPISAAARLWRRLCEREGPPRSGPTHSATGLVALGGFAFDPTEEPGEPWQGFPALLFRVPALAVTRVRGRTFATGDDSLLDLPSSFRAPAVRHLEVEPLLAQAAWCEAVAEATRRMRAGSAEKVVLAREVMARGDGVLAADAVVRALRSAYPACFTYLVSGSDGTAFTGASPELLVRRSGGTATCQPMAGSVARGQDEAEDEALARSLVRSAKDVAEHAVTARFVAEALAPLARSVEVGQPEVIRLTNIQHLATTIRARLTEPTANLLELAAALHPTPAINGWPRAAARRLITELEGMERGWYAGAVGWIDGRGDGELAVAIRCGLLWEDGARLYAGNGMMPDSDPQTELIETELKLNALLGALS